MPRRIEKIREEGVTELQAREKDLAEQIFRWGSSWARAKRKRSSGSAKPRRIWRGWRPSCATRNWPPEQSRRRQVRR